MVLPKVAGMRGAERFRLRIESREACRAGKTTVLSLYQISADSQGDYARRLSDG